MGLFRNHPPTTEPELTPGLKQRLDELEARGDRHERVVKELRVEWDEMYDKFKLLYARIAKRINDWSKLNGDGVESPQDAPGPTKDRIPGYGHPPLHERASTSRKNY